MLMISIDGASTDCGKRRKCWLQKKKKRRETAECFLVKLSLKFEIFPLYFKFLILFDSVYILL